MMAGLKGTKTHQNLKVAFAGESQANRRYLYFAKRFRLTSREFSSGHFLPLAHSMNDLYKSSSQDGIPELSSFL
jgi:hypothetical protein